MQIFQVGDYQKLQIFQVKMLSMTKDGPLDQGALIVAFILSKTREERRGKISRRRVYTYKNSYRYHN